MIFVGATGASQRGVVDGELAAVVACARSPPSRRPHTPSPSISTRTRFIVSRRPRVDFA